MKYYTEYPTGVFFADSDIEAAKNGAKIIYREGDSKDGTPFVLIKEEPEKPELVEDEDTIWRLDK